jgi:hypothetical protein
MGEAGPGKFPERSQAVPFVAEEICRLSYENNSELVLLDFRVVVSDRLSG